MDDLELRELIQNLLRTEDFVAASRVDLDVENGEVTLSGQVNAPEVKERFEKKIKNVEGVSKVHNNIKLEKADW